MDELLGLQKILAKWCAISSWSHDPEGLKTMRKRLAADFSPLGADEKQVGDVLILKKRPSAPLQIYLGGHYDTVHKQVWPLRREGERLYGPGVADMKGGLAILLSALTALEKEEGKTLGWTALLNGDEELGSPKSRELIEETARECALALLFEPTLPDGALVSARKGSANFRVVARGQAAHAGREGGKGMSATRALIDFLSTLPREFNIGKIEGGVTPNVVADYAEALLNIRYEEPFKLQGREAELTVETLSDRPPKPISEKTKRLMKILEELDRSIHWQKTGGVCDGNFVAAQGVACIDTLGVVGGGLHTSDEYCELGSLPRQSQLVTSLLLGLNSGAITWES